MLKDYKTLVINELESSLVDVLTKNQISIVGNALTNIFQNYDIIERCTQLAPYDDRNNKLIKRYLACCILDGKSEQTLEQYHRSIDKLVECIGNKPFADFNAYDIRFYLATEKQKGLSNTTIRNQRANISSFFNWLANEGVIQKNPCNVIKPPKKDDVERLPLSDVEIDQLRSHCKNYKERAIIEFLLATGVRVNELSMMKIEDVNMDTKTVMVLHGKGNKKRVTYMNDICKMYLQKYLESRNHKSEYLFVNILGDPIKPGGIRFLLRNLGKRSGVKNVHPHRFRRTLATILSARGMKIQEIQILLGHSNIATTMEYIHTDTNLVQKSYDQFII